MERRNAEALRQAAQSVFDRLHAFDADGAVEYLLLPDYVDDEVSRRWPWLEGSTRETVVRIVRRLAVAMWEGPR